MYIFTEIFLCKQTHGTHTHTHTHTHTPTAHMSLFSSRALSSGSYPWVCIRIMLVKTQTHSLFLRLTICILSEFYGDLGNTLRPTNFDPYFSKPVSDATESIRGHFRWFTGMVLSDVASHQKLFLFSNSFLIFLLVSKSQFQFEVRLSSCFSNICKSFSLLTYYF